ncbi:hypothetical protein SCHPADRAFT_896815 [Schizopora paradoxa]|uniref:Uncharacterized protein n=1 Tax=Schizopora paradoxa TaxID=27342 RepID=A0A0H2QZA5_9AGAM|nr:hypothetical protein SCHPADRAFT_896815 [Schizopora paradoxa]
MSCRRLRPMHWQPVRRRKLTFADIFGSYLAAQAVRRRASRFPTTSIFATLSLPKFVVGRLLVFVDSSGLEGELSLEFLLKAVIFQRFERMFTSRFKFKLLTAKKRTSSPDRVASAWQPCVPLTKTLVKGIRLIRALDVTFYVVTSQHFCGYQNSKSFNETSEEILHTMDDNVV